eukprot:g10903.t1
MAGSRARVAPGRGPRGVAPRLTWRMTGATPLAGRAAGFGRPGLGDPGAPGARSGRDRERAARGVASVDGGGSGGDGGSSSNSKSAQQLVLSIADGNDEIGEYEPLALLSRAWSCGGDAGSSSNSKSAEQLGPSLEGGNDETGDYEPLATQGSSFELEFFDVNVAAAAGTVTNVHNPLEMVRKGNLDNIVQAISSNTCPGMTPVTSWTSSSVRVGIGAFTIEDFPAAAEAMPLAVAEVMEAAAPAVAPVVAIAAPAFCDPSVDQASTSDRIWGAVLGNRIHVAFAGFVDSEMSSLASLGGMAKWLDVQGPGGPARSIMVMPLSMEASKPPLEKFDLADGASGDLLDLIDMKAAELLAKGDAHEFSNFLVNHQVKKYRKAEGKVAASGSMAGGDGCGSTPGAVREGGGEEEEGWEPGEEPKREGLVPAAYGGSREYPRQEVREGVGGQDKLVASTAIYIV